MHATCYISYCTPIPGSTLQSKVCCFTYPPQRGNSWESNDSHNVSSITHRMFGWWQITVLEVVEIFNFAAVVIFAAITIVGKCHYPLNSPSYQHSSNNYSRTNFDSPEDSSPLHRESTIYDLCFVITRKLLANIYVKVWKLVSYCT